MRWQVFTIGLVLVLAGCIVRSPEPVAQKKSLGKVLDDMFKGVADVAQEARKVDTLVKKASKTALKEDEVKQLAGAVVRGGSEAIEAFKSPLFKNKRVASMTEISAAIYKRVEAYSNWLSPQQVKEFEQIADSENITAMADFVKKNTNLADDKIFRRQVELHGEHLDEFAEMVADNHRLAGAVGAALADDVTFKQLNIDPNDIAAELRIGRKSALDYIMISDGGMWAQFIQEISGVDIWRESAHLELMLRRGGDGKPLYAKLSKSEVEKLGNPFDEDFTEPVVEGIHFNTLSDEYMIWLYKGPTATSDEELLKKFLEKYPPIDVPN